MNLGELHGREYGRILARLIRVVKDFDLAEDALQEAFAAALAQWPAQGPPQNPVAWLIATARHKAIDQVRRRALAERTRDDLATLVAPGEDTLVPPDSLRLIFTCCHPALVPEAQVALTLRTICGLSTEEIARAYLVPAPTLAQRLVRTERRVPIMASALRLRHEWGNPMEMLLENKTAVIYGAGGAIGGAVARAFAREGARVFLAGRTLAPLDAVAETAQVDTLDEQAVEQHAGALTQKAGRIDVSFNAIGIPQRNVQGTPLVELSPEDFSLPIQTYTTAQFLRRLVSCVRRSSRVVEVRRRILMWRLVDGRKPRWGRPPTGAGRWCAGHGDGRVRLSAAIDFGRAASTCRGAGQGRRFPR
jgi:DNA-directed RNA polymerase specialized sigma24 family protein